MTYRLAAVSFLNTIPLIEWLDLSAGGTVDLVLDLPSRLGDRLRRGEVQAALLPVVEAFRGTGDGLLWGSGIACRGEVGSVKLFLGTDPARLRRVRADRGSRTSVALTRVLLKESYGIEPEFAVMTPDLADLPGPDEALLVIGDRCFAYEAALRARGATDVAALDLGGLWFALTGLPFVFAAWTLAPGAAAALGETGVAGLTALLNEARARGEADLDRLARREADRGRLGRGGQPGRRAIHAYFTDLLTFRLGAAEMAGLEEFHRLCRRNGLVPDGRLPAILGG